MEIKNIVNLKEYPIDQIGSKEYQDLIAKNSRLQIQEYVLFHLQ